MNTTDRISPALLGLTFIGLSAIAGAQQPGLPAPGAPPLAPASRQSTSVTVQPAAPEKAVNVLERFTTSDMPLSDVISALQGQLRERNLPRLNILLAPGAEHFTVPPVDLFNVTGPDALLLIAAAAGLEAKPIPSGTKDNTSFPKDASFPARVIGYRIEKKDDANAEDPTAAQIAARKQQAMDAWASRHPLEKNDPKTPTVRVYALASITDFVPPDQINQTLRELLESTGADGNGVKISYHDKTNILVVRGSAELQNTVTELLAALEKNSGNVPRRDAAPRKDPAQTIPPPGDKLTPPVELP